MAHLSVIMLVFVVVFIWLREEEGGGGRDPGERLLTLYDAALCFAVKEGLSVQRSQIILEGLFPCLPFVLNLELYDFPTSGAQSTNDPRTNLAELSDPD